MMTLLQSAWFILCVMLSRGEGTDSSSRSTLPSDTSTTAHTPRLLEVEVDPGPDYGIVNVKYKKSDDYQPVCGDNFDEHAADVVCRSKGFSKGKRLQGGTFGSVYGTYQLSELKCTGKELHLSECRGTDATEFCYGMYRQNYASVVCSMDAHDLFNDTFTYEVSSTVSPVIVTRYGLKGLICADRWTDRDASVVCAEKFPSTPLGKRFVIGRLKDWDPLIVHFSLLNCSDKDVTLTSCSYSRLFEPCDEGDFKSGYAGVMCFKTSSVPHISLINGTERSGRVEITYAGKGGSICTYDSLPDKSALMASAISPMLSYRQCVYLKEHWFGLGSGSVYLENSDCNGYETSIFACKNERWNQTSKMCRTHVHDLAVFCYSNVKLMNGILSKYVMTGVLKVYYARQWKHVCHEDFGLNETRAVCRELGFDTGESFTYDIESKFITENYGYIKLVCPWDAENTTQCEQRFYNRYCVHHAAVACRNTTQEPRGTARLDTPTGTNNIGVMVLSIVATDMYICPHGISDREVHVFCKTAGFNGGYLRPYNQHPNRFPTVVVRCNAKSTNIFSCIKYAERCWIRNGRSLAYCYYEKPLIKLHSISNDIIEGEVRINLEGTWGRVSLPEENPVTAAKLICKELEMMAGKPLRYTLPANAPPMPTWFAGLYCKDDVDTSIFSCRYTSLKAPKNASVTNPFRVKCSSKVLISGGDSSSGEVQYYLDQYRKYVFICDNTIGDREATIICRENRYHYGKALIGQIHRRGTYLYITIVDLKCPSTAHYFSDCTYTIAKGWHYCHRGHYLSVACSNKFQHNTYSLSTTKTGHGLVLLTYFSVRGFICGDSFDNKAASVICREISERYVTGVAYRATETSPYRKLIWLRNVKCSGEEGSIRYCSRSSWGNATGCDGTVAGVICYTGNEVYRARIKGSSLRRAEGRPEIKIAGTWATVCRQGFTETEATVACREHGFNSGKVITGRTYRQNTDRYTLWGVRCKGKERSLVECSISGLEPSDTSVCFDHLYDVSIFCYHSVRLRGTQIYNIGQLEVRTDSGVWGYVSAQSIDRVGAKVVCRSLGFADGLMWCCSKKQRYRGVQMIPYKYTCNGSEAFIQNCTTERFNDKEAGGVGVVCFESKVIDKIEVVENLDHVYRGPVRLTQGGQTVYACHKQFDNNAANVFCKQNHYHGGGIAMTYWVMDNLQYFAGDIKCTGQESTLSDCRVEQNNASLLCDMPYMDHTKPVGGVMCSQKEPIGFRLVGGDRASTGRAGMSYNGKWGKFCYKRQYATWRSALIADIFCRSLGKGYGGGYMRHATTEVVGTDAPVYVTVSRCNTGGEKSLLDCDHEWLMGENKQECTSPYEDLEVTCYGAVRLTGGDDHSYGIVTTSGSQYKLSTICNDGFDDIDARVACKPNYERGMAVCCAAFGLNYMIADRTNVQCKGDEVDLRKCAYKTMKYSEPRCEYKDYAAVVCYNNSRPDTYKNISLFGASYTGSVVLNYMGINGPICADGWNDHAATVACHEMNYTGGEAYIHYRDVYSWYTRFHRKSFYLFRHGPYWATRVSCTGREASLRQCRLNLGKVTKCVTGHHAGALCYTKSRMEFRMAGSESESEGRVEVRIDGHWGAMCVYYFNYRAATVFCRQMGYVDGLLNYKTYPNAPTSKWLPILECTGKETSLRDCPHRGWKGMNRYCRLDAGVSCFRAVSLEGSSATNMGPLMYYANETWNYACDHGFNDFTAKLACAEMGYSYGKAVCCSAYGYRYLEVERNHTISCDGTESNIVECISHVPCVKTTYASVICLNNTQSSDDSVSFHIEDNVTGRGHVVVTQFGIEGRVCAPLWSDSGARVACRSEGYTNGAAYRHYDATETNIPVDRAPFLVSHLECSGSEKLLKSCSMRHRQNLGDCSQADIAGVVCFNDSGIKYRLVVTNSSLPDRGRAEVSLHGIWGTVCNIFWDNLDAEVFCKSLGRGGGVVWTDPSVSASGGPVWLSQVLCNGSEDFLHQCRHDGFRQSMNATSLLNSSDLIVTGSDVCQTHRMYAGVRCIGDLRLSEGNNVEMGAVEKLNAKSWFTICDNNWNDHYAQLACKRFGFDFGLHVPRNGFGDKTRFGPTLFKYTCSEEAKKLDDCRLQKVDKVCENYASVYCFEKSPNKEFQVKIAQDSQSGSYFGSLFVNMNGIWGRVCSGGWTETNSDVACKSLGFRGGVSYLHPQRASSPIVMRDVKCTGDESSLSLCVHEKWSSDDCQYNSNSVGIICHKTTTAPRLKLVGGMSENIGRLEFELDGTRGQFCNWNWGGNSTQVACRQMGYVDGYALKHYYEDPTITETTWLDFIHCNGSEESLFLCDNNGWISEWSCDSIYETVWLACYHKPMAITKVRLDPKSTSDMGRVDVLVSGAEEWGTVCDEGWDDRDARVVCRQLGYTNGSVLSRRSVHSGYHLALWTSAVDCKGNETSIAQCNMTMLGGTHCWHYKDAGVRCYGKIETTTKKITTSTKVKTTSKTTKTTATTIVKTTTKKQTVTPSTSPKTKTNTNRPYTPPIITPTKRKTVTPSTSPRPKMTTYRPYTTPIITPTKRKTVTPSTSPRPKMTTYRPYTTPIITQTKRNTPGPSRKTSPVPTTTLRVTDHTTHTPPAFTTKTPSTSDESTSTINNRPSGESSHQSSQTNTVSITIPVVVGVVVAIVVIVIILYRRHLRKFPATRLFGEQDTKHDGVNSIGSDVTGITNPVYDDMYLNDSCPAKMDIRLDEYDYDQVSST